MNGRLKNWLEGEALVLLLELTLVAALAVMLAHWTWVFVAPRASVEAPARSAAKPEAPVDVPRGLFAGAASAQRSDGARGMRLLGVVSPQSGEGGRAVFRLEQGAARAAGVGDAIAPGVILKEVHSHHVVVERNGALERLTLERRGALPTDAPRPRR
ncbi:MAG TPA: type II secretion system protein N [Burkholderiales bacterium]|nr:type II secretion system protein N [Burkholderiales bacterium]